jgi:hypothetical protein
VSSYSDKEQQDIARLRDLFNDEIIVCVWGREPFHRRPFLKGYSRKVVVEKTISEKSFTLLAFIINQA